MASNLDINHNPSRTSSTQFRVWQIHPASLLEDEALGSNSPMGSPTFQNAAGESSADVFQEALRALKQTEDQISSQDFGRRAKEIQLRAISFYESQLQTPASSIYFDSLESSLANEIAHRAINIEDEATHHVIDIADEDTHHHSDIASSDPGSDLYCTSNGSLGHESTRLSSDGSHEDDHQQSGADEGCQCHLSGAQTLEDSTATKDLPGPKTEEKAEEMAGTVDVNIGRAVDDEMSNNNKNKSNNEHNNNKNNKNNNNNNNNSSVQRMGSFADQVVGRLWPFGLSRCDKVAMFFKRFMVYLTVYVVVFLFVGATHYQMKQLPKYFDPQGVDLVFGHNFAVFFFGLALVFLADVIFTAIALFT